MNALVAAQAIRPLGSGTVAATKRAETTAAQTSAATSLPVKDAASTATVGTTATGERVVKRELDQDAFLQLLVMQMQSQDPLAPTDNTEMVAQLAQFTSLEQMNNLTTSFASLSDEIDRLNFVTAGSLLGRSVSGADTMGVLRQGKVEQVFYDSANGGGVYLVVQGQPVPLANIQQIQTATDASDAAKQQ